jgi:hypothetical protein
MVFLLNALGLGTELGIAEAHYAAFAAPSAILSL